MSDDEKIIQMSHAQIERELVASGLKAATAEELRAELRKKCEHKNERVIREGQTGTLGTVICLDCGNEREWDAY